MTFRPGVYIVPTDRWYIERTVWLIAGVVLLTSTTLALLVNRSWMLGVLTTGLVSIFVGLTGYCPVGNTLKLLGFEGLLDANPPSAGPYRMKTDKWFLERRIYVAVGFNISLATILFLTVSPWFAAFTGFVGVAMVWFAGTGFCIMANFLYWTWAEPRLTPDKIPASEPASPALVP